MSRTNLLMIVLALGLALAMVYLMVGYFREQGVKNRLAGEINTAMQTLLLLPAPDQDLAEQLARAKAENQAARQAFSANNVETTKIMTLLLETAAKHHLQADPISSEPWSKKSIGNATYRMLPVEISVSGSPADFLLFVSDLENVGLFPSMAIEVVSFTQDNLEPADNEAACSVKVNLSLVERVDGAS